MSPEPVLFQSLEPPKTPWTRWVTSLLIHLGAILTIVAIPVAVQQAIQPKQWTETKLVAPAPLTPPPQIKIQTPKAVIAPAVIAPKVKFKEPDIKPPLQRKAIVLPPVEPPKVEPRKMEQPKLEAPKIEVAKAVPQPKFDAPVPVAATPAPPKPAVKTDVFAANSPAPQGPKSASNVKMGGFGDPNGVPASATATGKGLTVAKVGGFEMPQGSGNGGGGGKGKVVASAGFGSAGAPGTPGYGSAGPRAAVQSAGFNQVKADPVAPKAARETAGQETPVEIVSKPKPAYSPEAKQMKLEGEVLLEVVFTSAGQIQVVRVVRGLGHGLDESARLAAQQIRFRPGTRGGAPVDMRGVVHIVFELS